MDELSWKKINILLGLILWCFLFNGCQKAKESEHKPEQKQEVKVQKEEVKQPEVAIKESPKVAEPVSKVEVTQKEQLSPLDRAKGKEIIQDGQPIVTWGSTKDLPTLDEVFPVVDKLPPGIQFPKGVERVELEETEERKRLRKNIEGVEVEEGDEFTSKLYAIKSPNGKCIIEVYGGASPNGKREEWLRSIDPETKKILWKYDEPGLSGLGASFGIPQQSEYFILTNLEYKTKEGMEWKVKLFGCQKGYIRDIYRLEQKWSLQIQEQPPIIIGTITPDGKNILVNTIDGKVQNFDVTGNLLWEKQINPYRRPLPPLFVSYDSSNFVVLYRSPDFYSSWEELEKRKRAGEDINLIIKNQREQEERAQFPEELRLIETKTGNDIFRKRFHGNLGDSSMKVNTSERGIINKDIISMWLMDGIGFVLDKTNPYGNVMVLFTKKDVFAFRIQSLGFTFSIDGKYVSANSKFYDLQSILSKAMGEGK